MEQRRQIRHGSRRAGAPGTRAARAVGRWPSARLAAAMCALMLLSGLLLPTPVEADAPQITAVTAQTAGSALSVVFDQGVYANNDGTGALTTGSFDFVDDGGGGVTISDVFHTAGSSSVLIVLSGVAEPGADTLDVAASVYNSGGEALAPGSPVTLVADDTAPSFDHATVESAAPGSVVATFDEFTVATDATGFSVEVNSVVDAITGVTITSAAQLTFALTTAVVSGDVVTLTYNGTGNASDRLGNEVAAFGPADVTNNVVADSTAPSLTSATVDAATLTLFYDESLDAGSEPAGSDFAVLVGGSPDAVTNVAVSGPIVALTLTTAAQSGETVTLSYTPGGSPIQDAAGNAAAALVGQSVTNVTTFPLCSADDTISCVDSVSVSDASAAPTPYVFISAGLVQVQLQNSSFGYELGDLGATDATSYTIVLELRGYTPRLLLGGGRDVSFTIDTSPEPDHTLVTVVTKPVSANQIQPSPDLMAWPSGSADTTTLHFDQSVTLAIHDLSGLPSATQSLLTGSTLATDAQAFSTPSYDAGTQSLSLFIAGPHFLSDGVTVHTGFFEAHLPQALLDDWGITQTSDLTGTYSAGATGVSVTTESGGMRVDITLGYSSGTVSLAPAASDANLASLMLGAGTLSPAFAAGTTAYTASVANGVTSLNVTPTLSDTNASLTVNGAAATSGVASTVALAVGANAIPIVVTAEDGATMKTYTLTVTRAAPPGGGGGDSAGGAPAATPSPTPSPSPTPVPTPRPGAGGVQPTLSVVHRVTTPVSSTMQTAVTTMGARGGVSVVLPPAALPAGTEVSVGAIDDLASLVAQVPPPSGVELALGFEVTAVGSDGSELADGFAQPVTLDFTLGADALPAGATPDELVVAFWNGASWVEVSTTISANADGTVTLTAVTDHFTVFGVLRTPYRGTFDRPIAARGVTAAVWRGGSVARIFERVPRATSLWVFDGGRAYGHLAGAPAFVNAQFGAHFATGVVPAGTIAFVVLP